jgi:hypothetical protein
VILITNKDHKPHQKISKEQEIREYTFTAAINSAESLRAMFENKLQRCFEMGEGRKAECRTSFSIYVEELRDFGEALLWWSTHSDGIREEIEYLERTSGDDKLRSMLKSTGASENELVAYRGNSEAMSKLSERSRHARKAWSVLTALYSSFTDTPDRLAPNFDEANLRLFKAVEKGAFTEGEVKVTEIMEMLREREKASATRFAERNAFIDGIANYRPLFESVMAAASTMRNAGVEIQVQIRPPGIGKAPDGIGA